MSRGKTEAGLTQTQDRQISIEDVAAAVTQGVLRAISAQRSALIERPPTTGGAALEFVVQFGGGGGGGLAQLGTLQTDASQGQTKK